MTDLVVGLGEIGKPLYDLLRNRNFKVHGYDSDDTKTKDMLEDKYDMIHICIPYSDTFEGAVKPYTYLTNNVIIHSTVPPGTSKKLGCIYSPVRGIHNDMYNHLQYFAKFYSGQYNPEFEKRFPKCFRVDDSTKLERTKIKDLEYYGLLIAYRKMIDSTSPIYWEFMIEQDQRYGNRPIMYNDNKVIGGHCITQNMAMAGEDDITRFIAKWGVKV